LVRLRALTRGLQPLHFGAASSPDTRPPALITFPYHALFSGAVTKTVRDAANVPRPARAARIWNALGGRGDRRHLPQPPFAAWVRRVLVKSSVQPWRGVAVSGNHAAMRIQRMCLLAAAASLTTAASASAAVHVVASGETLTSVAAADGLSISALAAANGLSSTSELIAGQTLVIPPQSSGATSTTAASRTAAGAVSSGVAGSGEPSGDDAGSTAGRASSGGGAYVVAPGDTLSAIAARAGTTVASLAAANGLDPNALLVSGKVLSLNGLASPSTGSTPAAPVPTGASAVASDVPPYPTPETVSAGEVGSIAADNGVPAPLAAAIGWQESGFNNDLVSSADARGVMQILPSTWATIQNDLAGGSLAPASAHDNVRGGVLLLHQLLSATGGDQGLAAAGYYQGLSSVRRVGMYADTRNYVNQVLALESRFGG
jgi:LysM repeat protein